jgi:hypothetical protein
VTEPAFVDPRTARAFAVWGGRDAFAPRITGTNWLLDPLLVRERMQVGYLFRDNGPGLLPLTWSDDTPPNVCSRGKKHLGHVFAGPAPGSTEFKISGGTFHYWLTPETAAGIHSAEQVVTIGAHELRFNLAAGGYLHRWRISGVDILNRADRWSRGLQTHLEWVDMSEGRLVMHEPTASACRYDNGNLALGAQLVKFEADTTAKRIHLLTVPIEWDQDGGRSIPGLSTDHGGDQTTAVFWKDMLVDLWLTLDYRPNLHKLEVEWTFPYDVRSAWFDVAANIALCLNAETFDEVAVRDVFGDTNTPVILGPDLRRFTTCAAGTFRDDSLTPTSPSLVPTGRGAVYARNTVSDLTVAIGQELDVVPSPIDATLNDYPRGTVLTYLEDRTGELGFDGTQVVVIGCDTALTTRFHAQDQIRRIRKGKIRLERYIATGTLAQVEDALALMP